MRYSFKTTEKKWQNIWKRKKLYAAEDKIAGKKNFYHLVMFPYPSGNLHIGHWYNFVPADVFARLKRMRGFNVLSPIGFDAFGLPAENAALKKGIPPGKWTMQNIKTMTKQLESMGNGYDWSREVITCTPEYYKWNQWLFLKLLEKGLAYRKEAPANWCPLDKTVLANEQVVLGKCERCGTDVVQKEIAQWLFKITAYAEPLLSELDFLDWPERTKIMQRNWIGKAEGASIKFPIVDSDVRVEVFTTRPETLFGATYLVLAPEHELLKKLSPRVKNFNDVNSYLEKSGRKTEQDRIAEAGEKTGVELKGIMAKNPATGKEIPIWISDYVLGSYGTGAIMAVPAHDERDFKFAKKFKLPIKQVVMPSLTDISNPPRHGKENTFRHMVLSVVHDPKTDKYLVLKWKKQPWTTFITGGVEDGEDSVQAAKREIEEETGHKNVRILRSLGKTEAFFYAAHKDVNRHTNAEHLLFELVDSSRSDTSEDEKSQYNSEWLSLKELQAAHLQHAEADILLKKIMTGDDSFAGEGILIDSEKFSGMKSEEAKKVITEFVGGKMKTQYRLRDWLISRQRYWGTPIPIVYCRQCGSADQPAIVPVPADKLPVLLPPLKDFKPADDGRSPLARDKKFLFAKCPKCGGDAERETDTMDTFVDSSWYYLRYTDPKNKIEAFSPEKVKEWLPVDMYIGGAEHTVLHLLYSRFFTKFLKDCGYLNFNEPFAALRHQGIILGPDGQKMSKSRGNVVDPDSLVKEFGADAVRMHLCFMGEYAQGGPWNPKGILGIVRFLERVWKLFDAQKNKSEKINQKVNGKINIKNSGKNLVSDPVERLLHRTVKKVGEDVEGFHFNTAVSSLMILLNDMEKNAHAIQLSTLETFIKLLAPFAPHMADELYHKLPNHKKNQSIHFEPWPKYDESLMREDTFRLVMQVNGKTRETLEVPLNITEAAATTLTLEHLNVKKHLGGREPKRIIFVPGRLINIVIDK